MNATESPKTERYLAPPYMQNRELSWLEFNKRVLDQSTDDTVPLLEQLSFISIFWSNLQEFFMVRVGSLTDLALIKKQIIDPKSGLTPSQQLSAIYKRCHELYPYYTECFRNVQAKLRDNGIVRVRESELTDEQREFMADYFNINVMPFLSPQIVNSRHPFPHLENGALYIVVRLDEHAKAEKEKDKGEKADGKKKGSKKDKVKNLGAEGVTLGIIPLPRQCDRIVQLPGKGCRYMLLEHAIEMFVPQVFSMYKVKHTNIICVTRNADLDATEGIEEMGEDYRDHMMRILKKRSRLAPVRLESEHELSATVKPVLMERLNLKNHQVFTNQVPLDMSYVYELPNMVSENKRARLTNVPFTPTWPSSLDRNRPILEQVSQREVLLSYPYESMDAFVKLLREAALDPTVISIKITLYRLAKQSHLAEALIAAADAGKEVTALFELRARFDESNNIEWSQRFEQAGCHVLYGFREFKVHSKVCCITRQTENGLQYITQLGTGNYNEKTSKLYTDFSFITSDPSIGRDAVSFFRNMALENTSDEYDILWVAPLQIKQNIINCIDEQIEKQRRGEPSGLFFKTNSITDKDVIEKIVEASQAGVKCTLLVRGISCIVPGLEKYTANVCVVSIVGRLLEHSRIYCFGPLDGDVKVYLSSADLMTRNMDKRIEIAWPMLNAQLRDEVIGYIGTCMADTAKLRDLLPNKQYTPLRFFARTNEITGRLDLFDSQEFLIAEAQRKHLIAAEIAASREANKPAAVRKMDEADRAKLNAQVPQVLNIPSVQEPSVEQVLADLPSAEDIKSSVRAAAPAISEAEVVTKNTAAPEQSAAVTGSVSPVTPANAEPEMPLPVVVPVSVPSPAPAQQPYVPSVTAAPASGMPTMNVPNVPVPQQQMMKYPQPQQPQIAMPQQAPQNVFVIGRYGMKTPKFKIDPKLSASITAPIAIPIPSVPVRPKKPYKTIAGGKRNSDKTPAYDSVASFFDVKPDDNVIVMPKEHLLFGGKNKKKKKK